VAKTLERRSCLARRGSRVGRPFARHRDSDGVCAALGQCRPLPEPPLLLPPLPPVMPKSPRSRCLPSRERRVPVTRRDSRSRDPPKSERRTGERIMNIARATACPPSAVASCVTCPADVRRFGLNAGRVGWAFLARCGAARGLGGVCARVSRGPARETTWGAARCRWKWQPGCHLARAWAATAESPVAPAA
jgi:hypothetical protein